MRATRTCLADGEDYLTVRTPPKPGGPGARRASTGPTSRSAVLFCEHDLDAAEERCGEIVQERTESADHGHQHHVDDRHDHREAHDAAHPEVVLDAEVAAGLAHHVG